jgi:molybdopterin-guanine dinucleotide biosynthesis protein A
MPPSLVRANPAPIGVVLAGGRGARMGGSKLTVRLQGRPLVEFPLQALRAVLSDVAVIAKPDVQLPPLPGVTVWIEPAEPHHPLVGIVEALALAEGRPVMICAGDLPLVTPALVARIVQVDSNRAPAAIASCRDQIQPLLGCYQPAAADLLRAAAGRASEPVRRVVASIDPVLVEVSDPNELFNVNSPDELLVAAGLLDQGRLRCPPSR